MSTVVTTLWDAGRFEFNRKLGNFVQYFQVNLPVNGHGVPLQLINPLIIAENMLGCESTDDIPDEVLLNAVIPVDYDDGMPVIEGVPIWERLEGESVEYYKLFKEYREMLYISGSRAISKLAEQAAVEGKNISVLSKVYHWAQRCRAFDVNKKMITDRKRSFEVERLEGKHAKASDTMLEQALAYLNEHPEQLNTKVAVQMVQLAVKVGRLSVGLNPEKPGTTEGAGSNTNITINQSNGGPDNTEMISINGDGGNRPPTTSELGYMQSLLHILDKTGAIDAAKSKVIDADYSSVESDEAVV